MSRPKTGRVALVAVDLDHLDTIKKDPQRFVDALCRKINTGNTDPFWPRQNVAQLTHIQNGDDVQVIVRVGSELCTLSSELIARRPEAFRKLKQFVDRANLPKSASLCSSVSSRRF